MDYSLTFARHFARLVWLLAHEPTNIDEQKASLRALVTIAKEGFVSLGTRAGELTANGTAVPLALSGVADVIAHMTVHGAKTIDVDRNATAPDILRIARQLVAEGAPAAVPGATARFGGASSTPTTAATAVPAPARPAVLPDLDFGEVLDDPIAAALERATPLRPMPSVPAPSSGSRSTGGMFDQFAATRTTSATPQELLARLGSESSPTALIELLDELAVRAEEAIRDERPAVALEIFHRIVLRERDAHEFEVKRAFVLTVKRLTKPALLKAVVRDLTRDGREAALVVLGRTGEDGADAVIEQLAAEEGRHERLAYFEALVQLQAGVPTLLHMLGDPRWYVARNAAAILGEMQAREAEKPLAGLLHHDDERVRHAATVALMRLGTARSLPTIQEALKDRAPQLRMQAAAALVGRKENNVTGLLLKALDEERDDEVCASFLIALGRLATPDAVARLIATAEPDKGLFRKKAVALRVAAVQGLSEARSDDAVEALKALQGDKDEDVRATAVYALGRRARGQSS
ncbi:MAG TPA: HEAT repeat domain-containing protein [Gemmatimonadaceae bacterium]|nr:HEAT repeat domain-containing protein [Gemmatimonadaceae bacterium]